MTGCSIAAKRMGNDLITGKKKIADISSEMKTATASTKALGVAMNIFANVGFMLAIAAITKVVSELAQAQENATQAAKEATETYKDEISSINDYKTKLSELHEELNSGNLSYEETKTKRTELMSIQDELIEKFGTEKGAIESVTEAINGQVDALDYLNEKSYRDWVAKADEQTFWNKLLPWGKSGLDQAVDYMETSQTVSFNDMQNVNLSEELQEIQKEIDETIRKKYNLDKSFATFNVTGTPDEIKSQLENIRQDYLDLSKNAFLENGISSEVWEEYRKEAIDSINEVINKFDEGLEKHQETYQTYIEGMIKYDSEYSDEYATILQKRAALESAENSGNADNIQKARQEFMDAINSGIEASGNNENVKKYFESLYPELQAEFASWKFEFDLEVNKNNINGIAKEIGEKYTATDLLSMVDDDSTIIADKAFNSLIDKAIEYGICTDKSAEEVQKLIDLLVKLGIVQGEIQGSTSNNETDILSFSDAWEDLKNSTEDATNTLADDLTKLAEAGQLTSEKLLELDSTGYFKNLGISAEEATKQINALVSASTQLKSMSDQISKMSDMLADKKNGTTATADDLAGFDAEVRGLDSWQEFEKVMGSTTSTIEECQAAANALASEWINNGNFLANLTDQNRDYYETQLKNMGIENAHIIVLENLAKAGYELSDSEQAELDKAIQARQEIYALQLQEAQDFIAKKDLKAAAEDAYAGLMQEAEGAGISKVALVDLIAQEQVFNNSGLSVSSKISELSALASAYLGTAAAAQFAANTSVSGMGSDSRYFTPDYVMDQWTSALSNYKVNFDISPSGSSGYKGGSSKSSGSGSKDTKQTVDWISRLLDVLQKKIDATKAKFDNLFTLKDKKNNLAEQITLTKGLLTATTVAADRYKKAAEKVGLSKELKAKVENGSYDITEYGSKTAEKIQKYQEYLDQYNELKQQEEELNAEIRNLKSDKYQLDIDNAENNIAKLNAQMDNSSSYKERIKYLKEERDYIKDSYYYQIKQAELNGELVKADELRAKRQKELTDNTIAQYQEKVDNAEAKIAKSQAYAELDAGNYKEQNKHLEAQKKYIEESYNWQIKIAKKKGETLEVDRLRAEKQEELNNLTKQEFDNIANTYDNKIGLTNNKIKAFQDQISLLEARGQTVGSALYTKQMSLNNINAEKLLAEKEKLIAKLADFKKGSDDWYDAQEKLFSIDSELVNIEINNANLQKSINQLKFDRFDDLLNKLNDIVDETDFFIDMLDSENFFDDNGKITDDGITAMGMYAQKYDVYLAEAEKYKEQMAQLEKDYQNDIVDPETYETKMREYQQGQRDMISSANSVKKSIVSLVKEGLDKQNEALAKSVEEQKKLLQEQQKARSLNQTLEDQNKRIARLRKQLSVLEADNSESSRKTKRQLQSELDDLLKEQDNTLYDQSVEDQTAALDKLVEDSEKKATEYLKNSEVVFVDALNKVNANTETVSKNIERISKETGVDISENITNAWKQSGNAVSDFGTTVASTTPGIISQISLITEEMKRLTEESEKAAKSLVKDTVDDYTDYTSIDSDDKNSGNSSSSTVSSVKKYSLPDIDKFITKNLKKANNDKDYYAPLNYYIYGKTGGYVLSKDSEKKLAEMLGVSLSTDLTGDAGRKEIQKILDALIKKGWKVNQSDIKGFAKGGLIDLNNAVRLSGEDGVALVRNGEYILSKPQTDGFLKLAEQAPQLAESLKNMTLPQFSYPQIDRNISLRNSASQSPVYNIDNSITVEGVATNEIVKDMANIAKRQVEEGFRRANNAAYAKGVRWR